MTSDASTDEHARVPGIVVGTRSSQLARAQTAEVVRAMRAGWPDVKITERLISTTGDRQRTEPLADIGGFGLFTREIERALLAGEIDIAVHSLKDLPTDMPTGLRLGAVPVREAPWDALVSRDGAGLAELRRGARVGTSSRRRAAQLLSVRPDLVVESIRGNLDTRLRKLVEEDWDAIVIAVSGLTRIGRAAEISEILAPDTMLPAVGQGALGIQVRDGDASVLAIVGAINDPASAQAVAAERSFLAALGGGCRTPIAGFARAEGGRLRLDGLVASVDGVRIVRDGAVGDDPVALGEHVADLLKTQGAQDILAEVG